MSENRKVRLDHVAAEFASIRGAAGGDATTADLIAEHHSIIVAFGDMSPIGNLSRRTIRALEVSEARLREAEQGERTLSEVRDVIGGYVVPCARCGQRKVIASDAINSALEVCGRCGVEIGLHELAEQGEVEWEYSRGYKQEGGFVGQLSDYASTWLPGAEAEVAAAQGDGYSILIRRRKAGPWEPVEENGETND